MNALAAHQSTVDAIFAKNTAPPAVALQNSPDQSDNAQKIVPNFDWVKIQLADHQATCEPAKILALTKQAIAKGTSAPI